MPDDEEMITIKKSTYKKLQKESYFLGALREAGVDNWEGYSEACRMIGDDEEED